MAQALASQIEYSEKYTDAMYEYRHVILPKELVRSLARDEQNKIRLQSDVEWRGVGIQMSRGWEHYAVHKCVLPPASSVALQPPYFCNAVLAVWRVARSTFARPACRSLRFLCPPW